MPIRHSIVHQIKKLPDGSPAVLLTRTDELPATEASENLLADMNQAYNNRQGKTWGLFHEPSGAYPFSGWLSEYIEGTRSFVDFSVAAVERLQTLLEESNLAVGGHVLLAHYQQGMTDYLFIAVVHHSEGVAIDDALDVKSTQHIDFSQIQRAARINISEWKANKSSRQYISFTAAKGGRKSKDQFQDFIGVQQSVDAPSETRTLLKAFSDFVEAEDLPEDQAKFKTDTLCGYAASQGKLGEPISLEELSGLIDEDRPKAFYDHIRNKDYGLAPTIPTDKKTLAAFRRFTGRAEGLSITFDSNLLGSSIEYDETNDTLLIRRVPTQLKEQLKRKK